MAKKQLFKPDLNILVMVIMLLFAETPMQWIARKDINIPANQDNTIIVLPLKQYAQTKSQLQNIIITVRFIYSVLSIFVFGNKIYNNNLCKKYNTIRLDMSPNYLYIKFILPTLKYNHIDAIKSAACTTILYGIKKTKLTEEQNTCAIYLAAFNTFNMVCRNKGKYSKDYIHSFITTNSNMPIEIIPNIVHMFKYCQYMKGIKLYTNSSIMYYPMKLNIMSNSVTTSRYVTTQVISIFHYIPTIIFCNKLEKIIKKYKQYYDAQILSIYGDDFVDDITKYIILDNNVFIN